MMALQSPVSVSVRMEKERGVSLRAGEIICRIYDKVLEGWSGAIDDVVLQMVNRFCVRLVFCLYADDAGIFAKGQFLAFLRRTSDPEGKRRSLLALFRALNVPTERRDQFDTPLLAFPHVSCGLFAKVEEDSIPMLDAELCALIEDEAAAGFNWADISPTIFGGLFESTINPKKRRMGGMHYTSVENIHRVIDPLFLDELKAELASILGKKERSGTARARKLKAYCAKLATLTFLDPACGSGNFLTETFISLRRLENEALQHLAEGQGALVSINQFYGIEINDFAVAVAKTALWIAAAQMWKKTQEFTMKELPDFQPLESYDNIREADALPTDWLENVPGRHLDYVISNPPFVGAYKMTSEQKTQAVAVFGKIPRAHSIDYVGAWYHKAAQTLQGTDTSCAFVSTNSITQGEQVAPLWTKLLRDYGLRISFAYRTFKWTNEAENMAAVHCVIIGFYFGEERATPRYIYTGTQRTEASHINPYLLDAPDVIVTPRTTPLCSDVPPMTYGNKPSDGGYLILSEQEREKLLARDAALASCIRQYVGAKEIIHGGEKRYCLWLRGIAPSVYSHNAEIMRRLEGVRRVREASTSASARASASTPYLFFSAPQKEGGYLCIPEVTTSRRHYIPIIFLDQNTIASNKLLIVPGASLYHFGILSSAMHAAWMRTVTGRLGDGYQYSPAIVYNNFPWSAPTDAQRAQIETCAQAVLDTRAKYSDSTLADLYDPLLMPPDLQRAHKALDAAVDAAYGRKFADETARVAHLFTLYEQGTGQGRGERRGERGAGRGRGERRGERGAGRGRGEGEQP